MAEPTSAAYSIAPALIISMEYFRKSSSLNYSYSPISARRRYRIFQQPCAAFIIFLIVMTTACQHLPPPHPIMTATGQVSILSLGDSYTIGKAVEDNERFPMQLAKKLTATGIRLTEPPHIIAQTGWTTADLAEAIAEPLSKYTLVTLLIGVNNQYHGGDLADYQRDFASLLRQAATLCSQGKSGIIVLSIPDWSATPYGSRFKPGEISAEIDRFNAVNRAEAEANGVTYVDITGISRQARHYPGLIVSDGLHPSAEMYRRWVELLWPIAREKIVLFQQSKPGLGS